MSETLLPSPPPPASLTDRDRLPLAALLGGSAVSLVGNQLTNLAIPWFVLQTTGSPSKTGLVAFFGLVPTVLASIFGGALVDRVGHKRTSVIADLLSGATVAMVPLLSYTVGLPFAALLALVFLGAVLDTPGGAARQALVPEAAGLAAIPLERVNSAFQVVYSFAGIVGPPLAGLLIVLVGTRNVLWVDAATFVVSAAAVAMAVPAGLTQTAPAGGNYLDDVRAGWRFLWREPVLRAIAGLAALINMLAGPLFTVLMPVLAKERYGSAGALGLALAAAGVGEVLSAVLYGIYGPRLPRRAVLIAAFVGFSLPLGILAALPPLWVTVAVLFVGGCALGPVNPLVGTVMQERIPAELRARVFGAVGASALVAAPLGVLLAGWLVTAVGLRAVFAGIAVGLVLVTGLIAATPALQTMDHSRPGRPPIP